MRILLLLLITMLTGCGNVISSDIKITDKVGKSSFFIPAGKYINSSRDDGIHRVYNLGNHVFQYKDSEIVISQKLSELSEELAKAKSEGDRDTIRGKIKKLQDSEYMKNHLNNDLTFETIDMDNGWFIAQVTNIIQEKFDDDNSPERYDFIVGWMKEGDVRLYNTSKCATKELVDKYGVIFHRGDKGEVKNLKSIDNVSNFNSFMVACINDVIQPSAEKLSIRNFVRIN